MPNFENNVSYRVFAKYHDRGWRLANGNLRTEEDARKFAESLAKGVQFRVTRTEVTVL